MYENISQVDFPKLEESILSFWKEKDIFKKSLQQRKSGKRFIFYDGPPFATGLPHYGHLLASTIKDIIPRYQTMRGRYVERRFGWDTHGLPVEMEMQKELGLPSSSAILDYGVGRFNEACRSIVLRYSKEWKKIISRLGRWVDFENDYKTMNLSFMESTWWVFKTLFDKGLIYEGYKVLPYSWKAATTLSNFEANLNYKDIQDPSISVKFKIKGERKYFIAWTTTPWTLISNLALCVHPTMRYVEISVKATKEILYLSKSRLPAYFESEKEYQILTEMPGKALAGRSYEPLFDFALKANIAHEACFKVLTDPYVTDSEGSGIVHQAPAYGEEDYRICTKAGIPVFDPVDGDGNFIQSIHFIAGKNIKEADKMIIKEIKAKGLLFKQEVLQHSYPFCWRTDTPLIYKASPTWFVKVEAIKEKMLHNNQSIHWVPGHIKQGRFGKWLENAKDWDIGRNRFWGTPLPIWKSKDADVLCFGSVKALEEASGKKISDIHKHFVDAIVIEKEGKTYRRISSVLDCWFESGAMPYAQNHYPFENQETLEKHFPADFIAEGLDQTRGWFYTLLVLSTCIMEKPPFENVIVNGLILAEDGKKMSKRLKNYPDPVSILSQYGADALRMYMIDSAVVRAESLRFSESGVKEVLKSILLPLWNSFSFFTTYANIDQWDSHGAKPERYGSLENQLDRWILSYLEQLNEEICEAMDEYALQRSVPPLVKFIDRLTNWYIRRSRRRFWKSENDLDKEQAYFTLYTVLHKVSLLAAPFMPFVTDKIYRVLTQGLAKESVHLEDYPKANPARRDKKLEKEMEGVEQIVKLGRSLRARHKLKVRQPLAEIVVITKNAGLAASLKANRSTILDELNIKEMTFSENEADFVHLSAKADFKALGKKLGPKMKAVAASVSNLNRQAMEQFQQKGFIEINLEDEVIKLGADELIIVREEKEGHVALSAEEVTVILNTKLSHVLITEGIIRDVVNRVQKKRKEENLNYTDRMNLNIKCDASVKDAIERHMDYLKKETLCEELLFADVAQSNWASGELENKELFFKIKKKE